MYIFSSKTPNLTLFSTFFINLASSKILPAPNISSITILIDSVTDALPPICPLANGNILADVTFLTCVAGDNTVLPNCVATLNCKRFLYAELCNKPSNLPGAPFNAAAISFVAYSFDILLFNIPRFVISPILTASIEFLAMASASLLNNHPCSSPSFDNLSKVNLFVDCVIA